MTKKELVWREILRQTIENKKLEFTQKQLAERFGLSLSTVFNALKIPRETGAVEVSGRNFIVRDSEKFLYIWATHRNLKKEIIYKTRAALSPQEAEGVMPPAAIFACYSAYRKKYREAPADYDTVYVYADEATLAEIKKRFPFENGRPNIFVLRADSFLREFGAITPDAQTFADLWNLPEWYARDFIAALKRKMFE
ncbi:MAG: winged helix-turn-helix domain-containing protein [Patescibacteria group bacterium]